MVDAFDLVDGPVKRGVLLAEDAGAVEVGEAGGVLIRGAGVHHQGVDGLVIRRGKVDGFLAGFGVGHAGDDGVDLALVQSFNQAVPVHLHDHQLETELIGDDAGDLNVIAFGIGAGYVLDGDVGFAGFGFLPVVGGVGAFHTDAELAVEVREGSDVFVGQGYGGLFGCGAVFRRGESAESDQHDEGKQQGKRSSQVVHFVSPSSQIQTRRKTKSRKRM